MQALTILNISASKYKVIVVFFNAMVAITGFMFFFVFKYMTKYQRYEYIDKLNRESGEVKTAMQESNIPHNISGMTPEDMSFLRDQTMRLTASVG